MNYSGPVQNRHQNRHIGQSLRLDLYVVKAFSCVSGLGAYAILKPFDGIEHFAERLLQLSSAASEAGVSGQLTD